MDTMALPQTHHRAQGTSCSDIAGQKADKSLLGISSLPGCHWCKSGAGSSSFAWGEAVWKGLRCCKLMFGYSFCAASFWLDICAWWISGEEYLCKYFSKLLFPTSLRPVSWHHSLLLISSLSSACMSLGMTLDMCMASIMHIAAELPSNSRRADSQCLVALCQQMRQLLSPSLWLWLESTQSKSHRVPWDVLQYQVCQSAAQHGVAVALQCTAHWRCSWRS